MASIAVSNGEWGDASPIDIKEVLNSVKKLLDKEFGSDVDNDILVHKVIQNTEEDRCPVTLYEKGINNEYQIGLFVSGLYWSKYAYQFAHKYCHVRTNYAKSQGQHKFKWFEESICELASLYALRRMSEEWKLNPPYSNWKDYSKALYKYADEIITKPENCPPENFKSWFKQVVNELEANRYFRDYNVKVAITLLPLFEENPILWNSMTYWNTWPEYTADTQTCFEQWLAVVPEKNREATQKLISIFF